MIDKSIASPEAAVADVFDGATVLIGGFGEAGSPIELIHALIDQGASDLTVVNNNTGSGEVGLAALIKAGRVARMICSYPRTANSTVFPELYRSGRIELEKMKHECVKVKARVNQKTSDYIVIFLIRSGVEKREESNTAFCV